jgi:DNA adenine methylase
MPYFGGKTLMSDWVNRHLPRSANAYVEGFAGSLAVGLARRAAPFEVVNDFDPGVANLYRVLKERPDALQTALRFTLQSRAEHALCRSAEDDRIAGRLTEEAVEWARRHLVLVRQSYSGQFRGSWGYVREGGQGSFHRVVDLIPPAAARLRNAVVENLHFAELIAKYDGLGREALWYFDPPYVPETRVAPKVYRCEMTLDEHRTLMDLVRQIEGMVVLSGYRSALYDESLSDWTRIEKVVPCYSSRADRASKPRRTECLWINPAAADRLREEGRMTDRPVRAA